MEYKYRWIIFVMLTVLIILAARAYSVPNYSSMEVVIPDRFVEQIVSEYNTDTETAWCVDGRYRNNEFKVSNVRKMDSKSEKYRVGTGYCKRKAYLHSHPTLDDCRINEIDFFYFGKENGLFGRLDFFGVVCNETVTYLNKEREIVNETHLAVYWAHYDQESMEFQELYSDIDPFDWNKVYGVNKNERNKI